MTTKQERIKALITELSHYFGRPVLKIEEHKSIPSVESTTILFVDGDIMTFTESDTWDATYLVTFKDGSERVWYAARSVGMDIMIRDVFEEVTGP